MTQPDRLRLVSHYPGRLRVRADGFRSEVGERVAARMKEEDGVTSAQCNPLTGSLLLAYDPTVLQLPAILERIVQVGGLEGLAFDADEDAKRYQEPAERIRRTLGRLNDVVHASTRGHMDVKTGFPLALSGLGLARLLAGDRAIPQWYDLMIWSVTTFAALNPRVVMLPPEKPLDPPPEADGQPPSP